MKEVLATEAARMLGVTRQRVSQLVKAKKLVARKVGHNVLVDTGSVASRLRWLRRLSQAA